MPTTTAGPDPLILALNSGSSSLKFGLFRKGDQGEELVLSGSADGIGREDGQFTILDQAGNPLVQQDHVTETQEDALSKLAEQIHSQGDFEIGAVGHRIVHGGPRLRTHQLITDSVVQQLEQATHFAPLHIPMALALLSEARKIFPDAPHFACFDTAFHLTLSTVAKHFALPSQYFDEGLFRYGFHGLSYESIVERLGASLPARAVFAHLGNGSSLCCIHNGISIDTTMGFTPTGGIPMSTRSGDLDPGALLYLMRTHDLSADDLENVLNKESGLAALSGGESDMRALLQKADEGDATSTLAVDSFTTAIRKVIGGYAALMDGIDLVVFTGGIGEHSAAIRNAICNNLMFLGLTADKITVLPAEEDVQIARHCRSMLASQPA